MTSIFDAIETCDLMMSELDKKAKMMLAKGEDYLEVLKEIEACLKYKRAMIELLIRNPEFQETLKKIQDFQDDNNKKK